METARVQGKHAGLSRDQILRAALALIDRDGAAALSMRRLARELGIEAMTLYHHVKNKDALEDALVERILAESIHELSGGETWQDALHGYARDLHRALLAHPGAVVLFATRSAATPQNLRVLEALLRVLCGAGFAPATALQIVHATAIAVIGQHATSRETLGDQSGKLSAELPLTREALAADGADLDARVDFMLTSLISGYEASLSR